jgi:membrane-associated phospholipid phosphatase
MDAVLLLVQVVAAAAWGSLIPTSPLAVIGTLAHLALAATLVAIVARPLPARGPARTLRRYYGWLLLPLAWSELAFRYPFLRGHTWDGLAQAVDRSIGQGTHLHLLLPRLLPWSGAGDLLHGAYVAYYPMLVLLPLAAMLAPAAVRDRALLRIGLTYWACFVIYFLLPVAGPRALGLTLHASAEAAGTSEMIRRAMDALGTAFPSSHTAGSLVLALVSWSLVPWPLAVLCSAIGLAMPFATMYTQNHYAVDVIAALAVLLVTQGVLVPLLVGRPLRLGRDAVEEVA